MQKKDNPMDKIQARAPNFSVSKAHKIQTLLSKRVVEEDRLPGEIKLVAGVDVAYIGKIAIGAASVLDYHSLEVIESQTAICEVKIPYIPTLLAFREIPASVACIRKLGSHPDVFLADGQGTAHPYGFGFASHLGIIVGKPTIGVAKSRLFGEPVDNGQDAFLIHGGKIVGSAIRTIEHSKPVYVSVGHLVSLKTAIEIVRQCICSDRIPEPLRRAHKTASERKQQLNKRDIGKFNSVIYKKTS